MVHGDDLVIATHGRGFWIMDDIALLRSLAGDSRSNARLLPPAVVYRLRPSGFTGTPMPKDEPMAPNPPFGAYIDYVLDKASAGPVTLTVSDSHGALVRRFGSDDASPAPDPARIDIAPGWIVPPAALSTAVGAHRFVWDLHYAQAQPPLRPEHSEEQENGAWAPPGRYQIELTAGGRSYRQPLTLEADPRVRLPAAAYAEQFELSRSIERARVEIAVTLEDAGRIHAALTDRATNASGALAAALAEADRQLVAISDISVPRAGAPSAAAATVSGLRYLRGVFRTLARAVDGSDTAPGRDVREGYARHRTLLDHTLADWGQFKAATLLQLNARLQSEAVAPISPQAAPAQ